MISVVIPVRDERDPERKLERILRRLPGQEVLWIDTSSLPVLGCTPCDVRAFHMPEIETRAEALNFGARTASCKILLFLHADCIPPQGADRLISSAIDKGCFGGAFSKRYSPQTPILRLQARVLNIAARRFHRLVTGTNAIFVKRDVFQSLGGFPQKPLFEDVMFFHGLRLTKHVEVLHEEINVSSRKYNTYLGLFRSLRNMGIYTMFRAGISPEMLAKIY